DLCRPENGPSRLRRPGQPRPFLFFCSLKADTIASSKPGKRRSISVHREVFCISTPRRSLRIRPASLNALKCCDKVDLGIDLSPKFEKLVHVCEQSEFAISAKMRTRTGSESACRIPSTVMSSAAGWMRGLIKLL